MRSSEQLLFQFVICVSLALSALGADAEILEHFGTCDASAAVAIGPDAFVVANDEDNVLRLYHRDESGMPYRTLDLNSFLAPDPKHPEADIEGATLIGDRIYWITSHGANKNGRMRLSRRRLFATEVKSNGGKERISPVGIPYTNLLDDLIASPGLREYDLALAATRAPKRSGSLNIEGLCATPEGALLIGFRNPIRDGNALIVPLENPREAIEGKSARLGRPIWLSLGGLGVRSIEYSQTRGKYLIVAGSYGERDDFALYQWSGAPGDEPEIIEGIDFQGLRPETLILYPGEDGKVQVLSDDGTRQIDGVDCKRVEPERRRFRSGWITP